MKEIRFSAHFVSGLIGLLVCYTVSIYLFWESQITLSNFRIDPQYSRFAQFLYPFTGREYAKPVAIIIAFLSVHVSWSYRFQAGFLLEILFKRISKKDVPKTLPGQEINEVLSHNYSVNSNEAPSGRLPESNDQKN